MKQLWGREKQFLLFETYTGEKVSYQKEDSFVGLSKLMMRKTSTRGAIEVNIRPKLLPAVLAAALLYVSACYASAAELELAGIRLGRSALTIIQKYGNPSEIRVGVQSSVEGQPEAQPAAPATGMELFTMGMSGMQSGMPGQPAPGQQPKKKGPPEVVWIYRFPKNQTLEFIISPDGRIMQIAAYGVEWPGVGTALGIRLGDTYKDVVLKYGFPESHDKTGIELLAKYTDKHRAVFTFVGKTVVGITIGLMD